VPDPTPQPGTQSPPPATHAEVGPQGDADNQSASIPPPPPSSGPSAPRQPNILAAGGGGSRKTGSDPLASAEPENRGAAEGPHRLLERNAGWLTLLSAAILLVTLAVTEDLRWIIAGASLFLLFVILLFTRPLDARSDVDTLFRVAWCFEVAMASFGLLFLLFGERLGEDAAGQGAHATRPPIWAFGRTHNSPTTTTVAQQAPPQTPTPNTTPNTQASNTPPPGTANTGTPSKSPPDHAPEHPTTPASPNAAAAPGTSGQDNKTPQLSRSNYLLAVVRGCDYNSVAYVNPRGSTVPSPSTSPGKTPIPNTTSPVNALTNLRTRLAQAGMPEGINCGELPPQWVLVIGGNILDCDFDSSCPKPQARPNVAKLESDYESLSEQLKDARKRKVTASNRIYGQKLFEASEVSPGGDLTAQLNQTLLDVQALERKAREAKSLLDAAKKSAGYNLNIEGNPIVGGVVVPVFFVVIALMGALVNMARKIPEFQERIEPVYKTEFDSKVASGDGLPPPITWPYARDLVVFQIVQVLSTPGIAILAYSWARPEDQATTVILAFAAGFTSEVFLLAIRGVVDRLIGMGPRPPRVRVALPLDRDMERSTVPPRGPANTSPASSGGFKVGDLVKLVQPVGPCMPGAEGIVLSIEPGGDLIVRTTRDHTGTPLNYRLQSQSPTAFQLVGKPPTPVAGGGPPAAAAGAATEPVG
jgi:hypothetical protein